MPKWPPRMFHCNLSQRAYISEYYNLNVQTIDSAITKIRKPSLVTWVSTSAMPPTTWLYQEKFYNCMCRHCSLHD
jgi:hypothetical protein